MWLPSERASDWAAQGRRPKRESSAGHGKIPIVLGIDDQPRLSHEIFERIPLEDPHVMGRLPIAGGGLERPRPHPTSTTMSSASMAKPATSSPVFSRNHPPSCRASRGTWWSALASPRRRRRNLARADRIPMMMFLGVTRPVVGRPDRQSRAPRPSPIDAAPARLPSAPRRSPSRKRCRRPAGSAAGRR